MSYQKYTITYTVMVYKNGDRYWRLNGYLHREDGPAVELTDGQKEWWINGERHREDGPSIEKSKGAKEWWINGKQLTEEEFNLRKQGNSCDGKIVEIDGVKYLLKAL